MNVSPVGVKGLILTVTLITTLYFLLFQLTQPKEEFWTLEQDEPALTKREFDEVQKRHELKITVTDELIAERITLEQAVEQFIVLNQLGGKQTEMVRLYFPAPTLEESTKLQILQYVKCRKELDPEAIEAGRFPQP
jgi:hypothetical protein